MSPYRPKGETLCLHWDYSLNSTFVEKVGTWLICAGRKEGNSVEVHPGAVELERRWNVRLDRRGFTAVGYLAMTHELLPGLRVHSPHI